MLSGKKIYIPSDARFIELFCLINGAVGSGKTSWEDKALDTGGRLFKSLSSPLGNIEGSLSKGKTILTTQDKNKK